MELDVTLPYSQEPATDPYPELQVTNQLTPWSRVFLEKLLVTELIKKVPAIAPCPKPDASSPHLPIPVT